jgi:hypothetical protein
MHSLRTAAVVVLMLVAPSFADAQSVADHAAQAQLSNSAPAGATVRVADTGADQPEMATGADLKGPPVRFPADNTPE